MERTTSFHYWNMFTIPALEKWLYDQAARGYIFESVRNSYWFTFRKERKARISYHVDFRGYIPDGYISYLTGNNWLVNKLSRNWQLIYRPCRKEYELLTTPYDEDMIAGLKRNTAITAVIAIAVCVFSYVLMRQYADNLPVKLALVLFVCITIYNVVRMMFYRAMLEQRIEMSEKQNNPS